jgi:hypothetical protein
MFLAVPPLSGPQSLGRTRYTPHIENGGFIHIRTPGFDYTNKHQLLLRRK